MTDLISADWRELDSDNTSPSPNGVQGGYSPSQIAPVIRAVRGSLKRFYNQSNAIYTSTGTAAAYVLTFQAAPSAYSKGIVYRFWAHITNTGAATLNINTLGARAIVSPIDGTALTAGQIVSGKMVEVIYNGTAFELLSDMGQNSKLTGTITITGNTVQTGTSTQTGNSTLSGLLTINRTGEALRISSGDATSDPFVSFFKTIDTTDTRQGYLQHADGTTIGTTGLIIHNDVSNMRVVLDNVSGTSGLTFRVGSSNYNVWNTGNLPLPANSNVQMIAGNGITGGGTLAADRTFTLGTPSDITYTSNNSVTATSHTHNLVITAANLNTIYGFTPANTTIVNSLSANVTSLNTRVSTIENTPSMFMSANTPFQNGIRTAIPHDLGRVPKVLGWSVINTVAIQGYTPGMTATPNTTDKSNNDGGAVVYGGWLYADASNFYLTPGTHGMIIGSVTTNNSQYIAVNTHFQVIVWGS